MNVENVTNKTNKIKLYFKLFQIAILREFSNITPSVNP